MVRAGWEAWLDPCSYIITDRSRLLCNCVGKCRLLRGLLFPLSDFYCSSPLASATVVSLLLLNMLGRLLMGPLLWLFPALYICLGNCFTSFKSLLKFHLHNEAFCDCLMLQFTLILLLGRLLNYSLNFFSQHLSLQNWHVMFSLPLGCKLQQGKDLYFIHSCISGT